MGYFVVAGYIEGELSISYMDNLTNLDGLQNLELNRVVLSLG